MRFQSCFHLIPRLTPSPGPSPLPGDPYNQRNSLTRQAQNLIQDSRFYGLLVALLASGRFSRKAITEKLLEEIRDACSVFDRAMTALKNGTGEEELGELFEYLNFISESIERLDSRQYSIALDMKNLSMCFYKAVFRKYEEHVDDLLRESIRFCEDMFEDLFFVNIDEPVGIAKTCNLKTPGNYTARLKRIVSSFDSPSAESS